MPADEVFRLVRRELRKKSAPLASRYGLKSALSKLGPDGFAFEKYVAALFAHQGYRTRLDVVLAGRCVSHEVDVLAANETGEWGVECKFHRQVGKRCDVKTALYVQARAVDLGKAGSFFLATNAKFSRDAVAYAACSGLSLLGWDHPKDEGLRELATQANLYPVTCLSGLRASTTRSLIDQGFVLCQDLAKRSKEALSLPLPKDELQHAIQSAKILLET